MAIYPFGIHVIENSRKKIPGKYESCQKLPTCNISLVPAPATTFSLRFGPKRSENVVAGAGTRLV